LRKAEALGAEVVAEFVDAGESARSANRPDLQRMLAFVAERRVDFTIVHKVDRLARNRNDDVEINVALTAARTQLVSCTENIDETPSGMLLHGIMSSIAEFYSRNLATESRKGMLQKAKAGGTPGKAPFGYLNTRQRTEDGREVRTVVTDLERAPFVRWLYESYATGEWTTASLRDELERRGVSSIGRPKTPAAPLATSQIASILKNRYYLGVVKFEGVEYPGRHEALISEQLFRRVQDVREARHQSKEKPRVRTHHLKGSIYCGHCGEPLSIEVVRNRTGTYYSYFYCLGRQHTRNGCTLRALPVHLVEQLVENHWKSVTLSDSHCREIRDLVWEHVQDLLPGQERLRLSAEQRLAALDAESAKLLQAHYQDAIPLSLLKTEQERIALSKAHAEQQVREAVTNESHLEVALDWATGLLSHGQEHYLAGNAATRRQLNQGMFERIWIDDDEVIGSDLSPTFRRLLSEDLEAELATDRARYKRRVRRDGDLHLVTEPAAQPVDRASTPKGLPRRVNRDLRSIGLSEYLRRERPTGQLPWERKNLGPSQVRGSNELLLVAGAVCWLRTSATGVSRHRRHAVSGDRRHRCRVVMVVHVESTPGHHRVVDREPDRCRGRRPLRGAPLVGVPPQSAL